MKTDFNPHEKTALPSKTKVRGLRCPSSEIDWQSSSPGSDTGTITQI